MFYYNYLSEKIDRGCSSIEIKSALIGLNLSLWISRACVQNFWNRLHNFNLKNWRNLNGVSSTTEIVD